MRLKDLVFAGLGPFIIVGPIPLIVGFIPGIFGSIVLLIWITFLSWKILFKLWSLWK